MLFFFGILYLLVVMLLPDPDVFPAVWGIDEPAGLGAALPACAPSMPLLDPPPLARGAGARDTVPEGPAVLIPHVAW